MKLKKLSTKKVLLIVGLILALFPIKSICGHPYTACAVPPVIPGGDASYYYEWEPLVIYTFELIVPYDPPIYYFSGHTN